VLSVLTGRNQPILYIRYLHTKALTLLNFLDVFTQTNQIKKFSTICMKNARLTQFQTWHQSSFPMLTPAFAFIFSISVRRCWKLLASITSSNGPKVDRRRSTRLPLRLLYMVTLARSSCMKFMDSASQTTLPSAPFPLNENKYI